MEKSNRELWPNRVSQAMILLMLPALCFFASSCSKDTSKNNQEGLNVAIIQDTTIISNQTGPGSILTAQHTLRYFRNNTIIAKNSNSEIILLGSGFSGVNDHLLDSVSLTGNRVEWTGKDLTDNDDGILIGYSIDVEVKYNHMQNCPYGVSVKSNGYTYTRGGVGYNVFDSSFRAGVTVKGVNNVKVINNTFYNIRNVGEGVIGSVYIVSNFDDPTNKPSTNCSVYNNVFYTKHKVANIYIDRASLAGFKCDYNLYWSDDGAPLVSVADSLITFAQWQNMGYDLHSLVKNPNFESFQTLIPQQALSFGVNQGAYWQNGLDITTAWNNSNPVLKAQGATWQVGAYVR